MRVLKSPVSCFWKRPPTSFPYFDELRKVCDAQWTALDEVHHRLLGGLGERARVAEDHEDFVLRQPLGGDLGDIVGVGDIDAGLSERGRNDLVERFGVVVSLVAEQQHGEGFGLGGRRSASEEQQQTQKDAHSREPEARKGNGG